jgi:hypothetical protein
MKRHAEARSLETVTSEPTLRDVLDAVAELRALFEAALPAIKLPNFGDLSDADDPLMSVAEAADLIGRSPGAVRAAIRRGSIAATLCRDHIRSGVWVLRRSAVLAKWPAKLRDNAA